MSHANINEVKAICDFCFGAGGYTPIDADPYNCVRCNATGKEELRTQIDRHALELVERVKLGDSISANASDALVAEIKHQLEGYFQFGVDYGRKHPRA